MEVKNFSDTKPELLMKLGNQDPPKNFYFKLNRGKELH